MWNGRSAHTNLHCITSEALDTHTSRVDDVEHNNTIDILRIFISGYERSSVGVAVGEGVHEREEQIRPVHTTKDRATAHAFAPALSLSVCTITAVGYRGG